MQEPFNIYPYRRAGAEQHAAPSSGKLYRERLRWVGRQWRSPEALVYVMIAFLMGRGVLAEQLAPFGIALLAVVLKRSRPMAWPVLICILWGEWSLGLSQDFWQHGFTYLSLILAFQFVGHHLNSLLWLGLFTAGWTFGFKAGFSTALFSPVLYDYLKIALEAIIAGSLIPPFGLVLGLLKKPRRHSEYVQEEMGSVAVFIFALLVGLNFPLGGYNIGMILGKYFILLAASGGAGWGAAFGGICGLVPGLIQLNGLLLAGLYAISGMLAGFLKHWGKWGLLLGFFCGNLFYGFYFADEAALMEFLATSALAALLLVLTPKSLLKQLAHDFFRQNEDTIVAHEKLTDTVKRLTVLFQDLAAVYTQAAVAVEGEEPWERLLRRVSHQVCHDCSLTRICWEKEAAYSLQQLQEWLKDLENKGMENPVEAAPFNLAKRCRKLNELAGSLSFYLAVEKANSYWQERNHQERLATAMQLKGAARALADAGVKGSAEESDYRPEAGFAQWARDGYQVCGDAVAAAPLDHHRWLFVLSDGMGSGETALQASRRTVDLLEQLLALDFSLEEAVNTVNSILLLNGDERFATIDLFVFDLQEQRLEFVKVGAVPSILIQQGEVRLLATNGPPAGILEDIFIETVSLPLEAEAVLVMVSDGIWQGNGDNHGEEWLPDFVCGIGHLPPAELAERIVEHGLIIHGGKARDDLSALVVRMGKV